MGNLENSDAKKNAQPGLSRELGPLMLWGLGVGYVISGMYFGWNLGLAEGGTWGLGIATFFVAMMYVCFTFSYTELTCSIPAAGGAFAYASRALGPQVGFVAGLAQLVEFLCAPPAIAAAIGAYLHIFIPSVPILFFAILAYLIFTGLNIFGVKMAATFELAMTIFAVVELLIFAGLTLPHFSLEAFNSNALPNGMTGIFASIPFAIWFFLAIEGIANVAEETKNPQKNMILGFSSAMMTLLFLCVLTFVSAVGVGGWSKVVFPTGENTMSDSPLPLALEQIIGTSNPLYHMLITVGIFGLVASFNGIILVAGRASYEFARAGYFPIGLGKINEKFKTPSRALLFNMGIGVLALLTGNTAEIIILACFGALTLYFISMLSLFALRRKEPLLYRPYVTPLYPLSPLIALILSFISFVSMVYYNFYLAVIYIGFLACSSFFLFLSKKYMGTHFFETPQHKFKVKINE